MMKRSRQPSGKKTHVPSDFKRLKAKVGKRAPLKANVTETKFETSAIKVKAQTIIDTNAKSSDTNQKDADDKSRINSNQGLMMTSKGKQLSQLLSQLNHPSANVRLSSLQGLKDAAQHTYDEVLPNYLSLLVPALSKAMVDEDGKVRKLAASIFHSISSRILANSDREKMKPFLPLALAYVSSGLHSLDQDIRYDSCVALERLCADFGKDMGMNDEKELVSLLATIPAFSILFDDISGGIASLSKRGLAETGATKNSKGGDSSKKKKNAKNNNGKSVSVLKSFNAVMRVSTLSDNEELETSNHSETINKLKPNGPALLPSVNESNMVYSIGGMASNSIVWNECFRKEEAASNKKLSLRHLSHVSSLLKTAHTSDKSRVLTNKAISLQTQIVLFTKLRNRFVEVTQKGNPANNGGLALSSNDVEECLLLIRAMRLLWRCHPRYFDNEAEAKKKFISKDGKTNEWNKFKRLVKSLLQMQLDNFPIHDPSGNVTNIHKYDILNATFCCTLSEFGSVLEQSGQEAPTRESLWVNNVFSYLLPQLEEDHEEDSTISQKSRSKVVLMSVVEQLLIRKGTHVCLLDDNKKQIELLSAIAATFFPSSHQPSPQLCRSLEGRRAVYILLSLIAQFFQFDKTGDEHDTNDTEYWSVLSSMAAVLPYYLSIWRGSFIQDSTLVLSTLLSISRRCEGLSSVDCCSSTFKFCTSVRESMSLIFSANESQKISVFEEMTLGVTQKMALSLLGILSHPSEHILLNLADICARHNLSRGQSNLSDEAIDYLMNIVHLMKDSFTLEQHIEFLVSSSGISRIDSTLIDMKANEEGSSGVSNDEICSFDTALAKSCRYLCLLLNDDEHKALSFLKPKLMSWLICEKDEPYFVQKLKTRASLSFVACISLFLLDLDEGSQKMFDEGLEERIVAVLCDFFFVSPKMFDSDKRFLSPILVSSTANPISN
jgi:hypothetical protein